MLLLAVMWAVVLLPPYLRSRSERLPSETRTQGLSALARRRASQGYMPVGSTAGHSPAPERPATPAPSSAVRPIAPTGLHVPRGSTGFEIRGNPPEASPSIPKVEPEPPRRVRPEPVSVSPEDLRDKSDAELLARYDAVLTPVDDVPCADAPLAEVTHLPLHRNSNGHANGNGHAPRANGNGHGPADDDGRPQVPPAVLARRQARARRRNILKGLLAASGVTLLMAFGLGGSFFFLHLLCDLALGGYVYMLLHVQRSQAEREIKVAFLPHGGQGAAPSALLEQSGGFHPGALPPVRSEVR